MEIEWRLEVKNEATSEFIEIPFTSGTINKKDGMEVSRMSLIIPDKFGYYFSWIENSVQIKLYKNEAYFFHGYITAITGNIGEKTEEIKLEADDYWHYLLSRRLTPFERFGKVKNVNPTTLARIAIGTRTFITEDNWENDKHETLRFASMLEDTNGTRRLSLGVRNNSEYTLLSLLHSTTWRVDEPDWQGSSQMNSAILNVTENLPSGTSSKYQFSRDDGETWYDLVKSGEKTFSGSETVKNKGKYKIKIYGDVDNKNVEIWSDTDNDEFINTQDLYTGSEHEQMIKTQDGTLHAFLIGNEGATGIPTAQVINHYISRDNGTTWTKNSNLGSYNYYNCQRITFAALPDGTIGICFFQISGPNYRLRFRKIGVTKNKGYWEWETNPVAAVVLVTSTTAYSVSSIAMSSMRWYDGSVWKQGWAVVYTFYQAGTATYETRFFMLPSDSWTMTWSTVLDSSIGNGTVAIHAHRYWGEDASSKKVIFVTHTGEYGDTLRSLRFRVASYTEGGSPSWSGWTTVDSGSCMEGDILTDRTFPRKVTEDYNVYIFYQKSTSVYCKRAALSDLTSWSTYTVTLTYGTMFNNLWDVSHIIDENFLVYYEPSGLGKIRVARCAEGTWTEKDALTYSISDHRFISVIRECEDGFGAFLAVFNVSGTGGWAHSVIQYSADLAYVTAFEMEIKTDSETGIQEGSMTSYTNAGLTDENVDYQMNRETRLSMLQNIQKMMPVASGSASPYPFWDMRLRVEGDVCYLDVDELLGDQKEIIIGHPDEDKGEISLINFKKNVDKKEIINALTLVGGGWSSQGIQVIPTKNVATAGVQAGTETQLAGTIVNKRMSTDLTIENLAYTILNITNSPRVVVSVDIKGEPRDNYDIGDSVHLISERYRIDSYLKIRGMNWRVGDRGTRLSLELDNGGKTLDRYMVEVTSNLSSISFNIQGELQRPPIFLASNFNSDEPASLVFYVPSNKKTKKALLYVKTKKYVSAESGDMTEFDYYPVNVKLFVDSKYSEEFGERGTEDAPLDINGLDITHILDADDDGLIDTGEHELKFISVPSTNNPNGLGKIEAYLVLLESAINE